MRRWGVAATLAALTVAGCATTGTPEGSAAREIQELETRVLELQRRAAVTDVELDRLRRRVAELESRQAGKAAEGEANDTRSSARPAGPVLENDGSIEVSDLTEEVPPVPSPASSPSATAGTAPPSAPAGGGGEATYEAAIALYRQGRHLEAESELRRYLGEHPDSDLADNAQFWIGAARFARGDLQGALAAFRETVERYPDGNKVPDALFKVGECLELLGDPDSAGEVYREVETRFPGSDAARRAGVALGRLP